MTFQHQYDHNDIEIIAESTPYDGFFRMLKYKLRHRLFDGGWSDTLNREVFARGNAVAVLPYDPKRREFVLIEQFRPGAMATCDSPWLLECVAGEIEKGESIDDVAHREASEEAGLTLNRLHYMLSYLSSPGGTSERLYVYLAEVDSARAEGVHGEDSEHEDIKVHRFSEADALAMLDNGRIDNASTVIALQWFALHQNVIQEAWGG